MRSALLSEVEAVGQATVRRDVPTDLVEETVRELINGFVKSDGRYAEMLCHNLGFTLQKPWLLSLNEGRKPKDLVYHAI